MVRSLTLAIGGFAIKIEYSGWSQKHGSYQFVISFDEKRTDFEVRLESGQCLCQCGEFQHVTADWNCDGDIMGVFDRIKSIFVKNRVPDTVEHKEYAACRDVLLGDITRFKQYIVNFKQKLQEYDVQGVDSSSPAYRSVLSDLQRFQYSLYEAEKALKFVRENFVEDVEYRDNCLTDFVEHIRAVLPESANIAFHGTPVYFAEEILRSGGICSTADRFDGYDKSTDGTGQISVSDINSLSRTVKYFLDVTAYQRCMPCGCLFVLDSTGQTAEQRAGSLMDSVNFNENPGKLLAVVSTPENYERIKEWLSDAGLSPDLAHTFKGFAKELKKELSRSVSHEPSVESLDFQINRAQAMVSNIEDMSISTFHTR